MSQVDRVHSHTENIDRHKTRITVPGPVYECAAPQCAQERARIESLALMPHEHLDHLVHTQTALLNETVAKLSRYVDALQLKKNRG